MYICTTVVSVYIKTMTTTFCNIFLILPCIFLLLIYFIQCHIMGQGKWGYRSMWKSIYIKYMIELTNVVVHCIYIFAEYRYETDFTTKVELLKTAIICQYSLYENFLAFTLKSHNCLIFAEVKSVLRIRIRSFLVTRILYPQKDPCS